MSSLFNLLGGNQNPLGIIGQFMQFQKSFQGNAQEEVQKIINSGRYSQADINKAQSMARTLQSMLGMK